MKFGKTQQEKQEQTRFFKAAFNEFGFKTFTNEEFKAFEAKYKQGVN